MSSNNNGCEIENGVEANREQEPLEREDNGSSRNVEDKTSPDQDVLNELQMQKTHDLYCPNCIHKVTETAKFFEKGEATFPYNKQRFLLGFVIVISFKYPFIYLPWLYNNTPDGSEATQRVVDETPRKHVLDWLWLLSVVVLLLLSATVLWVLLSPTRSLPLSPPLPSSRNNGNSRILTPDPYKIQEDAREIHGHPKPNVYDVVQEDVTEIQDRQKPHVPNIIADDSPIMPSPPPLLPLPPPHTDGSLTILVPDQQKVPEDVTKIHGHLKPHDLVEDDRPIQTSPPSLPLPLPSLPPHTSGSSKNLIPDQQKIPEDVIEIYDPLKPHVTDVVAEDDTPDPSSLPSLPPPSPHTNINSTTFIPDQQKLQEDATVICMKPHKPDVVEEDRSIQPSLPSSSSPIPPSSPPPHTNGRSAILIPDPPKIEDATKIHGRLKPLITDVVGDESHIPPSSPPPLPPPSTNGSLTVLVSDPQKVLEDITEIHDRLKPNILDVVEKDRPISTSLPTTQTPSQTNESLTVLSPDQQKIQEDVTDFHGRLEPHVPDVVEDDRPILPSQPHTNGSLNISIYDQEKIQEDVTNIHGHLKPHVHDRLILPFQPHTNGSLNISISDQEKIQRDVTDIHGHLKPHVPDVVEDDRPILLSQPHTNGSSNISIPDKQKTQEDVTDIHGHLKPQGPDIVEDDRPILPSQPHTNGSLNISIPDQKKIQRDVTDIHGHLKPQVPDIVEDDRPILPSQPHTNGSLNILVPDQQKIQEDITEIHGHLKSHVPDVVEDDIHNTSSLPPAFTPPPSSSHTNGSLTVLISGLQKISENASEIDGRLKPHVPDVVEDNRHIPSSSPPLVPTPHTNESLTISIFNPQKTSEDVTEVQDRWKPHVPDVVEKDRPISPTPPQIKKKGGWITLSWTLFVISLLLLVILALCLLSISWKRRTETKNVVAKLDESIGETQDSTNKPAARIAFAEDVTGVENNEDVASQNDDLSTTEHKANGSGTDSPPVISPPTTLVKLPGIVWKHIVVQVQNIIQTELDIVKSIVYGGLIESITSFGAVSAAAASGTSTLNVLALGLANLFSGLFLIIYNVYGLVMAEPFYQSANIDHMADVKATDPYEELLGSRKKVMLHCVVVVVSFIVFGVIPPLFYGFSFKITDNGHYEAAVFVAGSLVCVISLSLAKAYAFGMNKLKTVAAYTGIAISGSALSFIASQHARDVFAKYDFQKLASDYLKG